MSICYRHYCLLTTVFTIITEAQLNNNDTLVVPKLLEGSQDGTNELVDVKGDGLVS